MDPILAHTIFGISSGVFWIVMAVLMIPISAIVLGITSGIVKAVLKSQERRYQMRLDSQNAAVGISDNAAQDLRAEIARLRDTTTEHAMSIQHSLERLERRVEFLECKSQSTEAVDRPVQRIVSRP